MTVTILATCTVCKKEHEIVVKLEDLNKYYDGEHVQYAFPYLSAKERELLISGICGDCFDKMFGQE